MYYAVVDSDGNHVETVEADFPDEAVEAVDPDAKDLHAREATIEETFRYLVNELGLSRAALAEKVGTSQGYIGHRMRGDRSVRRLDVLGLERLRQLRDRED